MPGYGSVVALICDPSTHACEAHSAYFWSHRRVEFDRLACHKHLKPAYHVTRDGIDHGRDVYLFYDPHSPKGISVGSAETISHRDVVRYCSWWFGGDSVKVGGCCRSSRDLVGDSTEMVPLTDSLGYLGHVRRTLVYRVFGHSKRLSIAISHASLPWLEASNGCAHHLRRGSGSELFVFGLVSIALPAVV